MTVQSDIKKAAETKKLVIGSRSVIRAVKSGDVKTVIYANNCEENLKKDIAYYEKFGLEAKKFEGNSRQLGELCAKPFNVMILGIR
jgi:large subunit ribosomal protein L30e